MKSSTGTVPASKNYRCGLLLLIVALFQENTIRKACAVSFDTILNFQIALFKYESDSADVFDVPGLRRELYNSKEAH